MAFDQLSEVATAMVTFSKQGKTLQTNISNLQNKNAAYQKATFSEGSWYIGGQGHLDSTGIRMTITDSSNEALDQQVRESLGNSKSLEAQKIYGEQALIHLDAPVGASSTNLQAKDLENSGFLQQLQQFFNTATDWSDRPEDTTQKQIFLNQAVQLTDRFQRISENLDRLVEGVDADISAKTSEINSLLKVIGDLNDKISAAELNEGVSALNARRVRAGHLEELRGQLDFKVSYDANNNNKMRLYVVSDDDPAVEIDLISGPTVLSDLSYDNTAKKLHPSGNSSTHLNVKSGWMFGALETVKPSTGTIASLKGKMDTLAAQIVSAVNSAYNPSNTTGQEFFDPSNTTAATISLRSGLDITTLRSTEATDGSQNAELAKAIAELQTKKFDSSGSDLLDGTLSDYTIAIAADHGQKVKNTHSLALDAQEHFSSLEQQRMEESAPTENQIAADIMLFQYQMRIMASLQKTNEEIMTTLIRM